MTRHVHDGVASGSPSYFICTRHRSMWSAVRRWCRDGLCAVETREVGGQRSTRDFAFATGRASCFALVSGFVCRNPVYPTKSRSEGRQLCLPCKDTVFYNTTPLTTLRSTAMGIRMDDIHTPTVTSGPTSQATTNGTTKNKSLQELMAQKANLEAELSALGSVLDSV